MKILQNIREKNKISCKNVRYYFLMSYWIHFLIFGLILYKFKSYVRKVHFLNKTVWITGGSSGIGEALALEFVRLGAEVIISGRNLSELERVKSSAGPNSTRISIFQLDLSNAEEAYSKVTSFLNTKTVDILINNAGRSQRCGFLEDLNSLTVEKALMEINYFSVIALTKAIYGKMNEKGQIVVISSSAGQIGSPYRTSYSASKFAVSCFFQSLHCEVPKMPISVIYPSYVKTNISKNAIDSQGKTFGKNVEGTKKGMSAEKFAKIAVKGIFDKKKNIYVAELKSNIMIFLKYWAPSLTNWVMYKYGKKVKQDMEKAS